MPKRSRLHLLIDPTAASLLKDKQPLPGVYAVCVAGFLSLHQAS
ncbi:MAG: hypothetical protein ACOYU1_07465 [Bacteroidota bacterium]